MISACGYAIVSLLLGQVMSTVGSGRWRGGEVIANQFASVQTSRSRGFDPVMISNRDPSGLRLTEWNYALDKPKRENF